jgi:hypothetical protein
MPWLPFGIIDGQEIQPVNLSGRVFRVFDGCRQVRAKLPGLLLSAGVRERRQTPTRHSLIIDRPALKTFSKKIHPKTSA